MPHSLPTTIPRGNTIISRMLIAADDSGHSARALRYVGTLLRDARYWGPGTGWAHSGTGGEATSQGRAPA